MRAKRGVGRVEGGRSAHRGETTRRRPHDVHIGEVGERLQRGGAEGEIMSRLAEGLPGLVGIAAVLRPPSPMTRDCRDVSMSFQVKLPPPRKSPGAVLPAAIERRMIAVGGTGGRGGGGIELDRVSPPAKPRRNARL